MKKVIVNLLSVSLFVLMLALAACGGSGEHQHNGEGHQHEQTEATTEEGSVEDKTGPEYTSAYICPMHCEGSGSAEPGQCPVCGMDYVANTELDDHQE